MSKYLRTILFANSIFSVACGALAAIWPGLTATAILNTDVIAGFPAFRIVQFTGIGLLAFALLVFLTAQRNWRWLVGFISLNDAIWVTGSLALLWLAWATFTPIGVVFMIVQSSTVALFGTLQFAAISSNPPKTARVFPPHTPTFSAIGTSWMALKLWIKIWLFSLNAIFLLGFFFLDDPAGKITLVAYALSGPLLLIMMLVQRGLTRLLGIAHLIPWLPLFGYLSYRLITPDDAGQPLLLWLGVLWISLLICLLFDLWDVKKWTDGAQSRFGAPAI